MKFTMIKAKGKIKFTKEFPSARKEELLANGWAVVGEKPKAPKTTKKK